MSFQLGNFTLPALAGLDIDQQYAALGSEAILRAGSGRGIKQMTYHKLRVVTSGSGWLPGGLESLDFAAQHTLRCVVPRGMPVVFATRQATLPAARRSDAGYTPFATAIRADGSAVDAAVSVAGNVATVAAVSGAVDYRVAYYPQLTVWAMRPETSGNVGDASYSWSLTCEEV